MYDIISEDIRKFKIKNKKTAIVCSLARNRNQLEEPTGLFSSICRAIHDPIQYYQDVEQNLSNLSDGDVFETEHYDLPCDGIIHILFPRRNGDENCDTLKDLVHKIFDFALKKGYEAIAIPTIGTARGYSHSQSFNAIKDVSCSFAQDHPEIDIYFDSYYVEHRRRRFEEYEPNYPTNHDALRCKDEKVTLKQLQIQVDEDITTVLDRFILANFKTDPKQSDKTLLEDKWLEIYSNLGCANVSPRDIARGKYKKDDFLPSVCAVKKKRRWHDNGGKITSTGKMKKGGNSQWLAPTKTELLIIAYTLKMNRHDVYFLMRFCGYYLSEFSFDDKTIMDCIPLVEREDGLIEIIYKYAQEMSLSLYSENTRIEK